MAARKVRGKATTPANSHHPLLGVLAEAHFLLHGWLRSGGPKGHPGAARGAVEFLKEALALWGQRQKIRLVRADSGFFEDNLLSFLEERCLPYIVVARLTKWTKRQAQRVEAWFFATEAAFRSVLLPFNLLSEFQRAAGLGRYREPATIRTQVLTWGRPSAEPAAAWSSTCHKAGAA